MRKELKFIFIVLLLSILSMNVYAAQRYWIKTTAAYWNNTANWSSTSGGSGGFSVPGSSDTVFFDGGGVGNDTIDATVNIKRLDVASGFTGKIIQRSNAITIGSTGATLAGGTFTGGSASITVSGTFIISGTAFTSTSGTFSTSANLTISSGSFAHNNGTVSLTATSTLTISVTGGVTFYILSFPPTSADATYTITSTSTLTVSHLLSIGGTKTVTLNSGTINVSGDITNSNSAVAAGGGNATITINGTGKQTFTGTSIGDRARLPNITINKSSDTIVLVNNIMSVGTWHYIAGVINAGTSVVWLGGATVTGSHALNDVIFYGGNTYTISTGTTLTVNGTLTLGTGGLQPVLNTGTINAKKNITISSATATTNGGGSATIVINGSGTQSLIGTTTVNSGRVCAITINKSSSDTIKISNNITELGDWTYTAGIVAPGSSTIQFSGNRTITGTHALNNVTFNGNSFTYIIASGTTLTVKGTLLINGSGGVTINTGTINAQGNITSTNSDNTNGTGGNATININGTAKQTFTGSSSGAGYGRFPNIIINKSDTIVLVNTISVVGNWTYTAGVINAGTSVLYFITTKTITGKQALNDVTFSSSGSATTFTIASGDTITVNGTLSVQGTADANFKKGTINAKGNISISNSSTTAIDSAGLYISGTGNQLFSGTGGAGQGRLPKINIDKASGTLTLSSIISVYGDWIYTRGTVDAGTSTVALYSNANLDGQIASGSATMPFYTIGISGSITLTGDIDARNNLIIASGSTLSAGSHNITIAGRWNDQGGTWTYGTSTVTFKGRAYNDIRHVIGASPASETFYNLSFNRPSHTEILNSPVVVNHNLNLIKGYIKASSSNYLEFIDNATLTGGNDSAYVNGFVRKTGNDTFNFPLGDTTLAEGAAYHPLGITAPSSTTDQFEANYLAQAQAYGDSLVDSLSGISQDEYWTVERKAGTSNVTATISWNRNATDVTNYDDLRVANWNGTYWSDLGVSTITVTGPNSGNITASFAINFTVAVSVMTRARRQSSVPYLTLQRKLDGAFYYVSNGRLLFKYDEEYNDADRKLRFNIYGNHNQLLTSDALIPASMLPLIYTVYGDNRYQLNLADCAISPSGYLPNGYYVLEVINEKNEKRYLRFKNTSALQYVICSPNPN